MLSKIRAMFVGQLLDEEKRIALQFDVAYFLFFAISFCMAIENFFTGNIILFFVTLLFSTLSMLNFGLSRLNKKCSDVTRFLFAVEGIAFLTFFIYSGSIKEFSIIWVCLLPSFCTLLYRRRHTTIICSIQFVIIAFFMWIPYGNSLLLYRYSTEFRIRFPLAFLAFYALAITIETIRLYTYRESMRHRNIEADLGVMDKLFPGFYSKHGLKCYIDKHDAEREKYRNNSDMQKEKRKDVSVLVFDVKNFKKINEVAGTAAGDEILTEIANIFNSEMNCPIFRIGGDSLAAIDDRDILTEKKAHKLAEQYEKLDFKTDGYVFKIKVTVGLAIAPYTMDLKSVFEEAYNLQKRASKKGGGSVCVKHL